ncbi:MAG: hypothetical protein GY729_13080, partial [Desulfobacteraceae bacterium]|nr:hypothetical protein [Desulfobacteraceae bacterium]
QMVEAFYKALKDYAGSDEYVPEEWQELTLEFLLEKHIDLDLDTTLDYIIQMSRVEVEEFFFKLAPEFIVKWPVIKDESKHWKKSLTYFLEPDNKEHKLGMKKKPLTWDLDENFDSWDFEKRREYILEYIQSLLIDSYQGSDLRKVKSEKIENYIGWNSNIIQFKPTL